ncbi:hypothetical protein A3A93_06120 [Candidatus Roizmanbacteria bacterium RIFCSPLOWO2_01_FULL_38_12]|uniref:ribose-phosphate diphosphokinase n=1 Tax=Candidatus Roizmanbacteria bacterium RIFCSPLOWO2_01_FULL_38_12 TaxID=1802061 RepID=A0A1F7ITV9_9BACT|nr:MAG: hypothetical protein A3F59_01570 [Candidatus Roizmanbacteria bacterium RIFCSPHIGHO2_12_FULL_38_13]OGK46807.1 MAG: hypothetical protein A3A93_06120 [Candidatus Roizmanbacteria bacterium RIFCSPLOWO2_01_FULL_38_12]
MSLKLFSGTANPDLSKDVAKTLSLGLAKSQVTRFDNSEVRVWIEEDVKHDICVVIQSTSNPTDTNLMELFLTCDALRREEARKVIGIIPYFGYARQDIQHRTGECVSANVVIKFLEAIGFNKIYTINLHDEATEGVFTIPFKNLSAFPIIAKEIKKYFEKKGIKVNTDNIAIISPDQGGIERARKFGTELFGTDAFQLVLTEKKRDLEHIHESRALNLYGDVKDKIAVIVDDVSTSGGTLINSANICLEKGAKSIVASIIHSDFAKDTPKKIQNSQIEAFFTTDTIKLSEDQKFEKLHICSVAGLIAKELERFPNIRP